MTEPLTFRDDILECAGDEPIEAIVIGTFGWCDLEEDQRGIPKEKIGKVLTWDEAAELLNYSYDTGYGAPECHAITAWTKNWIIHVVQYDGSTHLSQVRRNPVDHSPSMPGG